MGINALAPKLPGDVSRLQQLLAPAPDAPALLPAYVDLLCQTGPAPAIEPEISLFLHGPQRGAPEASVAFRRDLDPNDRKHWVETVGLMPPVTGEKLAVPIWRLTKFLTNVLGRDNTSDVESEQAEQQDPFDRATDASRWFVIYRGKSDICLSSNPSEIETGDTIVLPAPQEFPTDLGTPGHDNARVDVYEEAYRIAHVTGVRRIHPLIPTPDLSGDQRADALALSKVTDEPVNKNALLAVLGLAGQARFSEYPDGAGRVIIYPLETSAEDVEFNPFAFDDVELLDLDHEATLSAHTSRVEARAVEFSGPCVAVSLSAAISRAARLHDLGKADERFQQQLNNGRRYGIVDLLAKSRVSISPSRWRQLSTLAGTPDRFRHEMLSMQLVEPTLQEESHRDLILHLIAAHHGHARPFAPVSLDEDPPAVEVALEGERFAISGQLRAALPPHSPDSGIAERFWRLTRTHGWWGLAYLETLLRTADRRASQDAEQEAPR